MPEEDFGWTTARMTEHKAKQAEIADAHSYKALMALAHDLNGMSVSWGYYQKEKEFVEYLLKCVPRLLKLQQIADSAATVAYKKKYNHTIHEKDVYFKDVLPKDKT